jgi:type VI secretion system secreted protein Hcp
MLLGAKGNSVKNAVFVARRAGATQNEYLKVTMHDVTVASYHLGGDDGDVPVEEISLRFSKVTVDYRPQKPTGALGAAIHMGWDVKNSKEA